MPEKATTKTCDVNVYNGERVEVGYDTGACWAHKTHINDSDVKFLQGFDAVFTSVNAKLQDDVHLVQDLPLWWFTTFPLKISIEPTHISILFALLQPLVCFPVPARAINRFKFY